MNLKPHQVDLIITSGPVRDEFAQKVKELDRSLKMNGMDYKQWDTLTDHQHEIFSDNLFLDGECAASPENYVRGAVDSCWCPDVVEDLHHHSPVLMREIEKQQEMSPDMTMKISESLSLLNEIIDEILFEFTYRTGQSLPSNLPKPGLSGKGKKKIEEKNVKYSDTKQDRIGMLIHDFVYIANCTKPKVCVIENVPSIKSSDVFHHALNRLRRWGYKVNFKVLCSSNFGVPQRRNRLIAIAVRPDICRKVGIKTEEDILSVYPQGSIYEPTLRDGFDGVVVDPQQRNYLMMTSVKSSGYELIKSIPKDPPYPMKLGDVDPDWTSDFNLDRASWYHPSPTLTQMGQQGGHGGVHHPDEDRVFTTDELKRLMGLPDDFRLTGTFNQKAEGWSHLSCINTFQDQCMRKFSYHHDEHNAVFWCDMRPKMKRVNSLTC